MAGKAGHPKFVEETIEDVLKFFKNSPVHQSQFKLHQQTGDDSLDKVHDVGYKLIHYHKIRWTSYSECVLRISALYDSLESYLRNASEDRANMPAVRRRCTDLHERLTDHRFVLYLLFLKDVLPILAIANKTCQQEGMMIHESYGQIYTVVKTLSEHIVINNTSSDLLNDDNILPLSFENYGDEGFVKLPGEDFNKYWHEVQENALLSTAESRIVLKDCHGWLYETVRNLLERFPELTFVTQQLRFVDPVRRDRICCDMDKILDRFNNNFLDRSVVIREYSLFRNDDTLDVLHEDQEPVSPSQFWCRLYKMGHYKELAKLAILVLTLSPNTVKCEGGFSCMNYIKNELRSTLTQTNLNAAIAIGSDKRS